ncbi:MAG: adenylate/guanylate cyclase domain-containing protein [Phycisphaerales bacterium]|nr:adenylate/guanylate cyclase domain-containing protein [Phycisphaerales bacterium]
MSIWAKLRGKPLAGGKRAAAMQRIQWAIGIAVTVAVATVWSYGLLDKYERDSIDFRAKHFASANAHPSDRIAIVAIDDAAIENVGRWPWDRQKLAAVIDELTNAGVSVVALDLLLDDRQAPRPVSSDGGVAYIPDDDILADAIRRHGRVISAVSFRFLTADEGAAAFQVALPQLYDLMAQRPDLVGKPWDGPGGVADSVRAALPRFKDLPFTRGKEIDKLRLRWEAAGTLTLRKSDSSFPLPAIARGTPWAVSAEPGVPVKPIADASKRIANVTFNSYDPDGLTRRIPLVVQHHDRLWPTLGVAAAIEYLNVQTTEGESGIAVDADEVRIRSADGENRSLAAFTQRVENSNVAGLHLVSWPRASSGGGVPVAGWQRQFYDQRARRPAEVPIGLLYEPARIAMAVRDNLAVLRSLVIEKVYRAQGVMDDERLGQWRAIDAELMAAPVGSPAWQAAVARAEALLGAANADAQTLIDLSLGGEPIEKLAKEDQDRTANLIGAKAASENAFKAIKEGSATIAELRHEMRARLSGTVCFVGWTATGSLADFVATSVDPRMPGVHVHAAVCNSLLTGYQRVPGPLVGQLAIVVALGLVGTWIGVRSSVVAGPLLIISAGVLWGYFASQVLWGMYDSIWSIAGPLIAASAGWLVVVLHRLLVEQRSRRKTEERFKSYVSPAVVDILVQNPSLSSMAPQHKELTVMFTDIAGFTTTAERLGSQGTAELLAVFLGTMTEVVQRHGATLDKYIGDAIMAFWGAPIDDALHARHACTAAVEMMTTLDRLNREKAFGAAGALSIRIGLATGDLMVGDFGNPPRNSSYTVIGDTANLSSRLEGASKVFGTRTLVSDLTRQLAGEGFLWRRIGVIKVKGKLSGIWVHELLPGPVKGDETAAWLDLCEALIADYQAERFEAALAKAVQLREQYRDEGFASAYGEAIAARQAGLVEGEFDGSIALTDK